VNPPMPSDRRTKTGVRPQFPLDCFEHMERVAIHGDTLCLWIRR
jgi:hypothetical protein